MMGKIAKSGKAATKNCTRVIKENSVRKQVSRVSTKRLLMLRRRLAALLDEKGSWETKNRELSENYNREKRLSAELQKDVFHWQRLYHEATIALNTYKVKHADILQNVSLSVKDMVSTFPHLVALSNIIVCSKERMTSQINSARSLANDSCLPRAFGDGKHAANESGRKSEKRMKHKVGPMVQGVLIQKPTIRLERVMLHQPPEPEPVNNNLSPTGENALTPIAEENDQEENMQLGQISIRMGRKHRLGSGDRWRMRKQEKLEKEKKMERERGSRLVAEESSDSEDQLEPVMRVSGLLLSPNLLEVDRVRGSESKGTLVRPSASESRHMRANDDPLEGCSWMNRTSTHVKNKTVPNKEKLQTSVNTSDSSDEESDTSKVINQKYVRNSMADSLYKNCTFTHRQNSSSSSVADTSREASDCSKHEPDSTNNIDEQGFLSSGTDSLGTNSICPPTVTARKHLNYFDTSLVKISSPEKSLADSGLSHAPTLSATVDVNVRPSLGKRRSSFCNNCSPIESVIEGKRIRKPKNILYPSEEDSKPKAMVSKVKKANNKKISVNHMSGAKISLGKSTVKKSLETPRTSLGAINSSQGRPSGSSEKAKGRENKKNISMKKSTDTSRNSLTASDSRPSKGIGRPSDSSQMTKAKENQKKITVKKSLETPRTSLAAVNSSQGRPSGSSQVTKAKENQKNIPMKKSTDTTRNSLTASDSRPLKGIGRPSGSSQKKKVKEKPKEISTKKSLVTPRNSTTTSDRRPSKELVEGENRTSRRNRGTISYKESPLNVKMRRI